MTEGERRGVAELQSTLAPIARSLGLELPQASAAALYRYASRLIEWNQRINLSGARDIETLAREHLADALALVPYLPRTGRCIDVGSGAGLPGIVLAILRPDLEFVLLEPSQKRRAFLAAITRELGLRNVSIEAARARDHIARCEPGFDFAVARAVFHLGEWLSLGTGLVRQGGLIAGLAGAEASSRLPPGAEVHPYDVGAGPRLVILVRK